MLERRHFLRSAAAAAAVGAIPAAALAAGSPEISGLDQHLEVAFARYLAAVVAAEAASKRALDISEAVQHPVPPAAIFAQPNDHDLGLTRFAGLSTRHALGRYSECAALRHYAGLAGFYGSTKPWGPICRRAAEILAGLETHKEAQRQAQVDAGLIDAERAQRQAWSVVRAEAEALASVQATTLHGVLMKARGVVAAERDAEGLSDWLADKVHDCDDPSTALATSLTADLIRIMALSGPLSAAASAI